MAGGRTPKEDDVSVLLAVSSHPDPFVTASDLTGYLDYSNARGIRNRLNDLHDKGLLNRKDVGARATVYWVSDSGRDFLIDSMSGNSDSTQ